MRASKRISQMMTSTLTLALLTANACLLAAQTPRRDKKTAQTDVTRTFLKATPIVPADLPHLEPSSSVRNASNGGGNATPGIAVSGTGSAGHFARWLDNNTLETSIISQANGKIGIATTNPTSALTVDGKVESLTGGFKFPAGTIQTTATASGLQTVTHDATLKGSGTDAAPIGISLPLDLRGSTTGTSPLVSIFDQTAQTTGAGGLGMQISASASTSGRGGDGLRIAAGNGQTAGGAGFNVTGGNSSNGGGQGIDAAGGGISPGGTGNGGRGVTGIGDFGQRVDHVSGTGVVGIVGASSNGAALGLAVSFIGDVEVAVNFNVTGGGSKNFKIDHPLDPENKYLYHAAIESSEVLNIYRGNVTTNENGKAVVALPDWFEAINRDFRYQLTVIEAFAQVVIGEEIKANHFPSDPARQA